MEHRALGNTGLQVSCIGLGAGQIGSENLSEKACEHLLHTALDAGINLIDTARGYGLSESRIGRYLHSRRGQFLLSTKIGYGIPGFEDWTPAIIGAGVAEALRQCRTDYLDIVHLHSCPQHILQHGELLSALENEVRAGRVRVAAYSGENDDLAFALGCSVFKSFMCSVNIADQQAIERFLPQMAQCGAGLIAKRPLANAAWRFQDRPAGDYAEVYWERLRNMSLSPEALPWDEYAIRFVMSVPGVHSAVVGTANPEHLAAIVHAAEKGPLDENCFATARRCFFPYQPEWSGQV